MMLRPSCPHCGGDHKTDRKTWPQNLEAFLAWEGKAALPEGATAARGPNRYRWAYFAVTTGPGSWEGEINEGTLVDAFNFHVSISRRLGQKAQSHLVTNPPVIRSGRTTFRRKDMNCEGIYIVWFDCDGEASWDRLRGVLADAGVAAIFTESSSRKTGKWHVGLPLAKPLLFQGEDAVRRKLYKLQYRHIASVLSALAGNPSVGMKCGFDLATDALCQPIYPPFKLSPEDREARFELLDGPDAIDWEGFLTATEFDAEKAQAGLVSSLQRAKRVRKINQAVFSGDYTQLKPMGKALLASGMLHEPKGDGLVADCPFNAAHAGNAKYLPDGDLWWCSHNSCRSYRTRLGQKQVLAALGPAAREVYEKASKAQRQTWWQVEKKRNEQPTNVGAWLKEMQGKAEEYRLLNAAAGALLRRHFSDGFVVRALSEVEDPFTAKRRVGETMDRLKRNVAVAGAGWIRRTLGVQAALALADAVARDTGQPHVDMARYFLGMGLARGDEGAFLKTLHDKLQADDKVRSMIWRPAGCRKFGDDVKDWGKKAGRIVKVCETLGCAHCFFVRIQIEADMLSKGWEQGGKEVEGWEASGGKFWIHRVTGLRDSQHLEELLLWVSRYCRMPKVRVLDWEDGKHAVTLITNDRTSASDVRSVEDWAIYEKVSYTESTTESGKEAAEAALAAKIRLHAHQRELVDGRKGEELTEWIRWVKGRHIVSRSRAALPWPTREAVKAASVAANREEWEFEPDYLGGGVTYTAVHIDTEYELGTSQHPHTLYQMMGMASRRTRLQEILEPPPADYFVAQAEAFAARDVRRVLAVPV